MKKIIISIILILTIILAWSKVLDVHAKDYNIETTKDVITTLAITRSINAALSVVQNSSLLLGVGVQVDMAIGQVVNPINDFLDRFSWILLFALISLGIQDFIIVLAQTPILNGLLTISIFLVIFSFYKRYTFSDIVYKFMIFLIFIRFSIPIIDIANGYIYKTMMQNQIITIQEKNQKFNKELQSLLPTQTVELNNLRQKLDKLKAKRVKVLDKSTQNLTYFDKLKAKLNYNNSNISSNDKKLLSELDTKIKLIEIKIDKVDINPIDKIKLFIKTVEHNMDMFFMQSYTAIILFLTRGIVFPILFLWILLRLFRELKVKDELFIENGETCKV